MLLPFSAIPIILELGSIPHRKRSEKDRIKAVPAPATLSHSEVDSDSSEESAMFVPKYIHPQKRNKFSFTSKSSSRNGSVDRSTSIMKDLSHHDSLNAFRGSPSVDTTTSKPDLTKTIFHADSTGYSSIQNSMVSNRNQSEQSVHPRRSGRTRQAPQNGEWVLNEVFIKESEDREYFVQRIVLIFLISVTVLTVISIEHERMSQKVLNFSSCFEVENFIIYVSCYYRVHGEFYNFIAI